MTEQPDEDRPIRSSWHAAARLIEQEPDEDVAAIIYAELQAAYAAELDAAMDRELGVPPAANIRGILNPPKPPGLTDTWAGLVAFDARPIGVRVRHHPAKEVDRG